jgi:hypothetical protein
MTLFIHSIYDITADMTGPRKEVQHNAILNW